MNQGIYIIANDRVTEQAIALLKSIRLYDPDTPIVMIPYNDQYQVIAELITQPYGVQIYEDLDFLDYISQLITKICGKDFFDRPNLLRKLACWFGSFDEFLYIDTDIIVFERIIDNLSYLKTYDFICCDYQHLGGINQIFRPKIFEIFTQEDIKDVFNSGFWGAKKSLISQKDLEDTFTFYASHPDYFYLLNSDQTVLNYLVLKKTSRRFNLVREPGQGMGNWAGSKHFQPQGNVLIDPKVNQPLKFLHWAGVPLKPGSPYWDIWKHYRYLGELIPDDKSLSAQTPQNVWQQMANKLRSVLGS
ncbi:MAG TPA: methionine synthase [Cyanobacteria bacterium UBA8803]|nr:methionine synthase [Cyanobacteria bacterium UBA9273]HBL62649.1 methionine synthase [Cyanobacteria bacterium UBA8803]